MTHTPDSPIVLPSEAAQHLANHLVMAEDEFNLQHSSWNGDGCYFYYVMSPQKLAQVIQDYWDSLP
jgi:hypothetical protein